MRAEGLGQIIDERLPDTHSETKVWRRKRGLQEGRGSWAWGEGSIAPGDKWGNRWGSVGPGQ